MDSDLLRNLASIIVSSIQEQDVTKYAELMDRNSCSLVVHYTTKGEPTTQLLTSLKPPVLPRTMEGYLAAVEAAKDGPSGSVSKHGSNGQYPPPMPPIGYYSSAMAQEVSTNVDVKISKTSNMLSHITPKHLNVTKLSSPRGAMNTDAPGCSLISTKSNTTNTIAQNNQGPQPLSISNRCSASPNSSPHRLRTIQNQIAASDRAEREAAVDRINELNFFLPLCRGTIAVSEHTLHIYDWLQRGKNIADVKVYTEVRKPRKPTVLKPENQGQLRGRMTNTGSSSLTEISSCSTSVSSNAPRHDTTFGTVGTEDGLPLTNLVTPISMDDYAADKTNKKASHKSQLQQSLGYKLTSDDRQYHSVVVVIYGRPNFLLQDECYFRDDGKIILIDRFCLLPTDPLLPSYIEERSSFFKLEKGRTDNEWTRNSCVAPPLDYSFLGMSCALDLLRVNPKTGKPHKPRPIFIPSEPKVTAPIDDTSSAMFFEGYWSQNKKNDGQAQRRLVVAKNRKGEEEAYEFVIEPTIKAEIDYNDGEESVAVRKLVQNIRNKYDADSVKLCNNKLNSIHQLKSVFRNLIANYFLTIKWLDLSCNKLTSLCDLTSLPLTTLYLHANQIDDWDVIEERVCVLPGLTTLTLHGNPIAAVTDYRHQAVMRLQRAKNLMMIEGAESLKQGIDSYQTSNVKPSLHSQEKKEITSFSTTVKPLKTLDFTTISTADLQTAQMYSQITKGGTLPLVPKQQGQVVTIPKHTSVHGRVQSPLSNVGTIIGSVV